MRNVRLLCGPLAVLLAGAAAGGCGSSGGDSPDAGWKVRRPDGLGADAFYEVLHPPLPHADDHGGGVLASPRLVTIFWGADPNASYVHGWAAWFAGSSYLKQTLSEYGVGPGSDGGLVELSDPPPSSLTDTDIQSLLLARIDDGTLPAPTANSIYLFFLPAGATETASMTGTSCVDFNGYHWFEHTRRIVYAVLPQCNVQGFTGPDELTTVASHEVSEASTDPFLTGWYVSGYPGGGEIGDLCAYHVLNVPVAGTPEGGYVVQREYSDAAAAADQDPCQPPFDNVYFNIAPDPGSITVSGGSSASLQLVPFSNGPLYGPMGLYFWFSDPRLTGTASATQFNPGQIGTLTVKAQAGMPSGSYILYLQAALAGPGQWNEWDVSVRVP